jgi:hypothetical protein
MSHKDLLELGLSGGPSTNKAKPETLFIVAWDGEGSTPEERIAWIKGIFPSLSAKIDAMRDPRATVALDANKLRTFRPKFAKPIVYETTGVRFPEGCGTWSGLALLIVNTGRQTTKCFRAINVSRAAENAPALQAVCIGRRFETDLERRESRVIENSSILRRSPMQRAWDANDLHANGVALLDIAPSVDVTTEQGVLNLIALLKCSEQVQAAADAGPENGGITQRVALEIVRLVDHDKQDAELSRRLEAAKGKSGRARSKAINGDKQKPVKAKVLGRVKAGLLAADASDPHGWAAILAWTQGDDAGYDALPGAFKSAVLAAEKKPERVKVERAPKASRVEGSGKRRAKKEPSTDPVAVEAVAHLAAEHKEAA